MFEVQAMTVMLDPDMMEIVKKAGYQGCYLNQKVLGTMQIRKA